ncbi:MAG: translation initiation factor IF-3 [Deltaproteobacteria bacterium]|nr:translation initiation factor IF-3 [Deltaproteobacteria bacterium]
MRFRGREADRGPRINLRIRGPQVRVIGSEGQLIGLMTVDGAVKLAMEEGLDLVEISPNAKPPVCKIMDYGKYKYEKQKKENENKKRQTKVVVKEIKLRPSTDKHDIDFKVKHARRFIEDKDKAKISIQFRGREIAHLDRAKEMLSKIIESLSDIAEPEVPPKVEGRTLSVILGPRKTSKG